MRCAIGPSSGHGHAEGSEGRGGTVCYRETAQESTRDGTRTHEQGLSASAEE